MVADEDEHQATKLNTLCKSFLVLVLRNVEVVDIGGVMLAVVQLHYLCVDVGLQGSIVIGQIRQRVLLSD